MPAYHTLSATPISQIHYPCPHWTLSFPEGSRPSHGGESSFPFSQGAILQAKCFFPFLIMSPIHRPSLPSDCITTMSTSKLPPRKDNVVKSAHENPVWTLSSTTAATSGGERASPAAEPPLTSMCDVHARPDAVCCRTLKGDDERSLIDPDVVK